MNTRVGYTGSPNLNSMTKDRCSVFMPQVLDLPYFVQGIRFCTKSELNSRNTVPVLLDNPEFLSSKHMEMLANKCCLFRLQKEVRARELVL